MEQQENINLCATCQKRAFDPARGIVCGLTDEKPTHEGDCPDYAIDEQAVDRQEKRHDESEVSISGWLAFFLWIGVGVGALATIGGWLYNCLNEGYDAATFATTAVPIVLLGIIAASTMKAFYGRKTNAVALAKTYIAMIFIDGVVAIILEYIMQDFSEDIVQCVRQFIWSAIWFCFIIQSADVKALIPVATRTWGKLEKGALALYIAFYVIFIGVVYVGIHTDEFEDVDQLIESINQDLPRQTDDNDITYPVTRSDHEIIYTSQFNSMRSAEMDGELLELTMIISKYHYLKLFVENAAENTNFIFFLKNGFSVTRIYTDVDGHKLCSFTIRPEEYARVASGGLICPISTLSELIDQYSSDLPKEYIDHAPLTERFISQLDDQHILNYVIQFDELNADEKIFLTHSFLEQLVESKWEELWYFDPIRPLAELNRMPICIIFKTETHSFYQSLLFVPDQYKGFYSPDSWKN